MAAVVTAEDDEAKKKIEQEDAEKLRLKVVDCMKKNHFTDEQVDKFLPVFLQLKEFILQEHPSFPGPPAPKWTLACLKEVLLRATITEEMIGKLQAEELLPDEEDHEITALVMDSDDMMSAMEPECETDAQRLELKVFCFVILMITSNMLAPSVRET